MKDKLASQLESKNISSKYWWKIFKILIRKDKTDPIPALIHNGFSVTDPSEKANIFNDYFQLQTILDESDKTVPPLSQPVCNHSFISVETEEVRAILKSLTVGKACGPEKGKCYSSP